MWTGEWVHRGYDCVIVNVRAGGHHRRLDLTPMADEQRLPVEEKQSDEAATNRREMLKKIGPAAYLAPGLILLSMPLKASSPAGPPVW